MNVLHLHCDLSSCPSSSFIRPKVAISNLYQQPIYRERLVEIVNKLNYQV